MKRIIALLLACMLLTGCAQNPVPEAGPVKPAAETEKTEPTETSESLDCDCAGTAEMPRENEEIMDFGIRLLQETVEEGKNILLSPLSVLAALSVTANGAEGETLVQMESVLGQKIDGLNEWYQEDVEHAGHTLQIVNAVYLKDDPELTVNEAFIRTIEQWYEKTDVMLTLFNEYTADHINQYVKDNTDGMIQSIVNEVPKEALLYLVNALAFEAPWANPYNEYQVSRQVFTTEDGRKQTVELMYAEENDVYVEDTLFTGFLKDYEGGRYQFAALLPKEGVSVKEVADSLSGDLTGLLNSRWGGKVLTALPKFQTEFQVEIGDILQVMGMTDAFAPDAADFSGLAAYTGGNLYLNRVLHKSFLCVGEQGTRAGAATAVEMAAGADMAPEEIKEVILNRPFLYLIWDVQANTPIFMGTFMDAKAERTSVPADDFDLFYSPAEEYLGGNGCIVDE